MATTGTRDAVLHLVEELPDALLEEALRRLTALRDDPVLRAYLEAPEDDAPETEEEREAWAEAEADVAAGRVIPHAEVRRRLLGDS
jgi:hypothetical protein